MVRAVRDFLEPTTPQERVLVQVDGYPSRDERHRRPLNRACLNAVLGCMPGVRFFKKEIDDPRWTEFGVDYLWAYSSAFPLMVRGKTITMPWMVSILPTHKMLSEQKWRFYDALHEVCQSAGFATIFVSGTDDRYLCSHMVAPTENDAVILDAYVSNCVDELRNGVFTV